MALKSGSESEKSHTCRRSCLGPLTFHPEVVGSDILLTHSDCRAERSKDTFKNGVVFSSRPVHIKEKIRLKVEKRSSNWHGALRLGFTSVPPSARSLPLPIMAIPNLTKLRGHWAAAVDESHCQLGSELEFWVCASGVAFFTAHNHRHYLLEKVDTSKPLWAMIDVYGQTRSLSLLGSRKKRLFGTKRSCPAPERLPSPDTHRLPCGNTHSCISWLDSDVSAGGGTGCVVCMSERASITLPCGHRCLCSPCAFRVMVEFGTCPLCRHTIAAPR